MENILIAFLLTLFAGLSTGIGSALAFFTKKTNTKFLSISLGFSAGVMIYVSFVEIIVKAQESLIAAIGSKSGQWVTVGSFFLGILVISLIDKLVPEYENPHHPPTESNLSQVNSSEIDHKAQLKRMGVFSALAIAIHNFP